MEKKNLQSTIDEEDEIIAQGKFMRVEEGKIAKGTETLSYDMQNNPCNPSTNRTNTGRTFTLKQIRELQAGKYGYPSIDKTPSPVHTKAEEPGLGLTPMNSRDFSNKIASRYKS
ncbi:uncharacterized protein SOCG_02551 [Schizosaccharomyces octosporus yFS286]|uniref:Uncharacterized protein n=1 Tax=Schizosaccharomyces octosporus (strain yFS286) TaxID=483514 RepID=S9RAD2_SCHOY|nr:uncharacterized protein SOCG_02551 [Schizosaccharomyces octosporus yFS286]EPX75075.1 hypothetical protein SOCG_02551 [Schizosaccharomyces octosporus yFS286]